MASVLADGMQPPQGAGAVGPFAPPPRVSGAADTAPPHTAVSGAADTAPPPTATLQPDPALEKELLDKGCAIVFDASRCTSWGSTPASRWSSERMVLAENFVVFLKQKELRSTRAFTILSVQQVVVGKSNPLTVKIRLLCGSREQEVILRMDDRKEAEKWKAFVEERRQYLNEQLKRCEMAFVPVRDVTRQIRLAAEAHEARRELEAQAAREALRQLALRSRAALSATWLRGLLRARLNNLFDWSAEPPPPPPAPAPAPAAGSLARGSSSSSSSMKISSSPSAAALPSLRQDAKRQIRVQQGLSRLTDVVDGFVVRNERLALHRVLRWRCGKVMPRVAAHASQAILAKPTKAAATYPAAERNEDVEALERLGLRWAKRRCCYDQKIVVMKPQSADYTKPRALADSAAGLGGSFLKWPSKKLLASVWSAWRFYAGARQRRHTDEVVGKLLSYNEQFLQAAGRLPVELAFSALDVAVKSSKARRLAYAFYVLALGGQGRGTR